VIRAHHTAQDLHLERLTGLTDEFTDPYRHVPLEHPVPVLRHPNEVVLDRGLRVIAVTVLHLWNLTSSPLAESCPSKDGGFNLGQKQ